MTLSLTPHPHFHGREGPVLLVIADGVGIAPPGPANAVTKADTPTLDALSSRGLFTQIRAHGTAVGLPDDSDMGNSEVGHNAMGAGRIFEQGASLVENALATGALFESALWQQIVDRGTSGGTLHFIGLHSDGNVHSHVSHLYRLAERAAREGVSRSRFHLLLDGRDVQARSALTYLQATGTTLTAINDRYNADYQIASGGGRMTITMDRYEADWDMVKRGYDCHVHGIGRPFPSAVEAVETMYRESPDRGDQYLDAFVITDANGSPAGRILDGDAVVFFNFRGDRAIEISLAFEESEFEMFDRGKAPDVLYAGMLQYDGDLEVPRNYLVSPPSIDNTVGEYLCAAGIPSFAISETQKYGHVTYFWNGNRSGYIDEELETYIEIPSDNIEFDQAPVMKAVEITDKTIDLLLSGQYRFGRLNFANGDMVGHTGNIDAAVEAMEAVDRSLARLLEVVEELGGILIYTADHGNVEVMYTEKDGSRMPKTSHTLNPVPLAIIDASGDDAYRLADVPDAGLGNIAATLLNLLGFEAPDGYLPSLIEHK
jgi:2,3-bisphosphoglycerate-independent phosphoglycerate mutase